jgi:hypothetical protein
MANEVDTEKFWEGYFDLAGAIRAANELPGDEGVLARQALKQFLLHEPLPPGIHGTVRDIVGDGVRGFEMADRAFGRRPPEGSTCEYADTDWGFMSTLVDDFLAKEGYTRPVAPADPMRDHRFPELDEWPDFSAEPEPFPFKVGTKLLPGSSSEAVLRRKSDAGDARATHDLALIVWDQAHADRGSFYPEGNLLRESTRLFRKAADAGLAEGKFALGFVEVTVVGMKDLMDAAEWFKQGAALGHEDSKRALEWMSEHVRVYVSQVRK